MARDIEIVTPPDAEGHLSFLTVAEFRRQALLTSTARDTEFAENIRDAVDKLARDTRRTILPTTFKMYLPEFPASGIIELPRPPLVSVTHVKYLNSSGVETTLSSSDYIVRTNTLVGNIEKLPTASWPTTADHPRAVRVTYVAGYDGTVHAIPFTLKRGVYYLAKHFASVKDPTTAEARVTILSKSQQFTLQNIIETLQIDLPYGEDL